MRLRSGRPPDTPDAPLDVDVGLEGKAKRGGAKKIANPEIAPEEGKKRSSDSADSKENGSENGLEKDRKWEKEKTSMMAIYGNSRGEENSAKRNVSGNRAKENDEKGRKNGEKNVISSTAERKNVFKDSHLPLNIENGGRNMKSPAENSRRSQCGKSNQMKTDSAFERYSLRIKWRKDLFGENKWKSEVFRFKTPFLDAETQQENKFVKPKVMEAPLRGSYIADFRFFKPYLTRFIQYRERASRKVERASRKNNEIRIRSVAVIDYMMETSSAQTTRPYV